MEKYDIILILSFGRENLFYFSIIKYLSVRYKIGIMIHDDKEFINRPHNATFKKVKKTEKKFRDLCVSLGAKKIYSHTECSCRLMLMYPFEYEKDYFDNIKTNVKYEKLIGLFFHARGFKNLDLLKDMGACKYFAPGKFLIEKIAKQQGILEQLEEINVEECGYPYSKYPVFDNENYEIDYLIALPSIPLLNRNKGEGLYGFVKMLKKVLKGLEKQDKVYIKYHNVRDKQRHFVQYRSCRPILNLYAFLYKFAAVLCPIQRIKNGYYSRSASYMFSLIEQKYPSLEAITEYHNFGIELFLPNVKKGIFTGLSGTIFHALYNRINVYNFDPQKVNEKFAPYFRHFCIPTATAQLEFNEKHYDIIPSEVRDADIIKMIESELT